MAGKPPITLRQASAKDAAAIVEAIVRSFAEYEGRLEPPSNALAETVATISGKIARGGALVCEAEGTVVGFAVYLDRPDSLFVGPIGVVPEFRNRGIGDRLMEALALRARTLGHDRIRLWVRLVLGGLRGWYEARGYRAIAYHGHEGYEGPVYVELEKVFAGSS